MAETLLDLKKKKRNIKKLNLEKKNKLIIDKFVASDRTIGFNKIYQVIWQYLSISFYCLIKIRH